MKIYAEATTFDEDALTEEFSTKRQNFTETPTPPYSIGDLWTQGDTGDIMVCRTARSSGEFSESDWEKASKYTDDSALDVWLSGDYADTIDLIKDQIDSKAETFYQGSDPSANWTASEKEKHTGDLWYDTRTNTTHRYTGVTWEQQNVPTAVFDAIDGKAQIFVNQPMPPYAQGDLWFNSSSSDILTCMTPKTTGQSFESSDWVKRNKYTDDSAFTAFRDGTYANFVTNTNERFSGKTTTFYQASPPTATATGDLWIDTDDSNKLHRWSGSSWVAVRDAGIQEALTNASNAQSTADGKIVTFAQPSPGPTAADTGDLWIATNEDNKLYRWNGESWVDMRDGTIAEAAKKATAFVSDSVHDGVNSGIFIHEESEQAADRSPATGTGVLISDAISIIKSGIRQFWAGIENGIAKVKIGLQTAGNVILDPDGMKVYKGSSQVAEFGQGVVLGTPSYPTFTIVNDTTMEISERAYPTLKSVANSSVSYEYNLLFDVSSIVSITITGGERSAASQLVVYNPFTVVLTPASPETGEEDNVWYHTISYYLSQNNGKITIVFTNSNSGYNGYISQVDVVYRTQTSGVSRLLVGSSPINNSFNVMSVGGGTLADPKNVFTIDWRGNASPSMDVAQLVANNQKAYRNPDVTSKNNQIVADDALCFGDCFELSTFVGNAYSIKILKDGYYYLHVGVMWSTLAGAATGVRGVGCRVGRPSETQGTVYISLGSQAMGRDSTWEKRTADSIIQLYEGDDIQLEGRDENAPTITTNGSTIYQAYLILRPVHLL